MSGITTSTANTQVEIYEVEESSANIALVSFSGYLAFSGTMAAEFTKKSVAGKRISTIFSVTDGVINGAFDADMNPDKSLNEVIGMQVAGFGAGKVGSIIGEQVGMQSTRATASILARSLGTRIIAGAAGGAVAGPVGAVVGAVLGAVLWGLYGEDLYNKTKAKVGEFGLDLNPDNIDIADKYFAQRPKTISTLHGNNNKSSLSLAVEQSNHILQSNPKSILETIDNYDNKLEEDLKHIEIYLSQIIVHYELNSLSGLESQANFGARQDGKYKVVSTSPSVNKTPRGSSTPSISYDVQEDLGGVSNVSSSVFFNSKGAYVKNSNSTKVTGDEPGTKKGVKSGTLSAQSDPLEHSSSVFINGQEVVRVNDVQYMQGKNTLGKVVSDESGQKPAISDDGEIIGKVKKPIKEILPNKNKPSNNTTQTGALGSFRGSPVILKNGMSYVADTDITLKSIIDIDLIRVYISDDYKSGFGNGWRMVYDNRFINTKDNIFVLYTTDGLKYRFEMVDGEFKDMDNLGVDIDVCNDTYTITYSDKTSYTYKNSQLIELCDKNGNCLEFIYDKNSLLTTIKSLEASLEFTYNPKGLIHTIQDHSGRVFAYIYDTFDNLIQVIYPNKTTKRYKYIQTISGEYYISEVINQLDLVTLSFTYDIDNKVQSYTNTQESFSYQYEPNRVIKTSNDGQKTFYKLDDFGAILAITYADKTTANEDYDIDTNSSWIKNRANKKSFYKYDDKNRVVLSQTYQENIVYSYMDDTKFVSTANIDNKITSYTYDDSYNITHIIHPNSTQEIFTYDKHGNILTHTDSSNLTKSYSYNNQGKIISISDEANNNEYFEYDEIGRVVSYVQKSGIIEVYKYDMMDNITHVFKDGLLFVAFGYDKANRLLSISDHMDNTTYFKYDNFTLSQIIHPNQTTTKYTITQDKTSITLPNQTTLQYEYDKHTQRLTKLTTPNMQISYKYDKFGNILSATDDTYSLSYVYDNNAKVLRSSYDDKDIVYSYDENELFSMGFEDRSFYCSRDKPNNTLTIQTNSLDKFEFVYDTKGNIVSLKYPNDFTMINKYTNLSKLCFSTTPHKELSYIYDNNNQIVSHNDIRYKYDSNQRLIKSNDKSYSYDLSNNLLSYNSIYDTITNQLISNDIYECNYDILGNMTQKHNKQTNITTYYKYDDLSRLIEYKQINNTTNDTIKELRLSYNPLSQRASKYYKDKNESYYHKYIYDKHNIIGIYDARSDELLASFIHILDNIDRPLSITTNKGIYYYHLDTNNSVIAISNKLGEIVQRFTYDDFGYIIDKYTHFEYKELEVLNPYVYTSREYDSEELYYYRARYYDPTIQRFITPDPISYLSEDINFYAYVSNNPINLTDPSGLSPQVDIPNTNILSNIYGKNIAKDLPKNSFIDILTPPTSPTNAEPMGKDGFKVRGVKPKLDIGNTLYFVFYTKGGTKNDSIFQDTAKERVKYIKEDTLYCKNTDIVYLLEANKTSQILSLVKEKVAKHGGEEKTIIRSIEVFADSLEKQTNNVFNTIDEKIEQMKSNAENEWEKAINGFHSANEQMVRLFNGAQKIYYGLTNSLNTLEHNKDTIKNNISDAYNKAHPAAQMSLNTSLTLVEFGATIWLPIVIQIPYDFYSGANFNTIPTSPSGFIGNQLNTPLN